MMTVVFCATFFVLTALTFRVWLKMDLDPLLASVLAVVFFVSCFVLGVYFSIVRVRGETWII